MNEDISNQQPNPNPIQNNAIKPEGKPILRDEKGLFQEGTAPGPGRTLGSISVITVIKNILQEMAKTTDGTERQRLETLARNIVHMAINERDKDMIKLIVNYIDGLPVAKIIGAGEEGEHIFKWEK